MREYMGKHEASAGSMDEWETLSPSITLSASACPIRCHIYGGEQSFLVQIRKTSCVRGRKPDTLRQ